MILVVILDSMSIDCCRTEIRLWLDSSVLGMNNDEMTYVISADNYGRQETENMQENYKQRSLIIGLRDNYNSK